MTRRSEEAGQTSTFPPSESRCDLAVVGAGLSGLCAALFAAEQGLSTALAGVASALHFSSGFIDLLAVHPMEAGRVWSDPWKAIKTLRKDLPRHPYARIADKQIRIALDRFFHCLGKAGLDYIRDPGRNIRAILPVGAHKTTHAVPASMWPGVVALEEKKPCCLIDIQNLRGFSARQIVESLKPSWKQLSHARIAFPGCQGLSEVYPERMAASLTLEKKRAELAAAVLPHIGKAESVGFPAIFGLYNTAGIIADMEKKIGRPVFEIPTMPPSIPGLRIKEALEAQLKAKGVAIFFPRRIVRAEIHEQGFLLHTGDDPAQTLHANAVILAGGRFIGKGLSTEGVRIKETLFDLPVFHPEPRRKWHRTHFLDPRGHLINLAGLETDDQFRPIDEACRPVHSNLYAVGSILAHQDWMRMKCGAGLAIATAHAAVRAFCGNRSARQ